jgi:hypothetical protein
MATQPNIDLDNAKSDYDLIDAGVHIVTVLDGTIEQSAKHEPMAVYSYEVFDGPSAGKRNKLYLSLTPKALWRARQFRDACGVTSNGTTYDTEPYVGRRVRLAISQQDYTDDKSKTSKRTQVDDFFPLG